MKHIVLDTNILMGIAQFRLDIISELTRICDFPYDISILDKTLIELEKIKNQQAGKQKLAAAIARDFVKKNTIPVIETSGTKSVDDILAELSHAGYTIITQDKALKKRLKKPYMTLRKQQYLMLV